MGGALSGERVLEFGGDNGDAVDGKGHVDDATTVLAVRLLHDRGEGDLARDGQSIPGVVFRRLGVHGCVRPEIGHVKDLAVALEPVAQDVECALELQLLREAVQHGCGSLRPEKRLKRLPFCELAVLQEAGNVVDEKGDRFVKGAWAPLLIPAGAGQPGFDRRLELTFGMPGHGSNHLHRGVLKGDQGLPLHLVKMKVANGWIGIELPVRIEIRVCVFLVPEQELSSHESSACLQCSVQLSF